MAPVGEGYAPADELLPGGDDASDLERNEGGAPGEPSGGDAFARSRERFDAIVGSLESVETDGLEHSELEDLVSRLLSPDGMAVAELLTSQRHTYRTFCGPSTPGQR